MENDHDISSSGIFFLTEGVLKHKQAGGCKRLSVQYIDMHCAS